MVSLGGVQGECFSGLVVVEGCRASLLPAFSVYIRAHTTDLILDASAVHILQLCAKAQLISKICDGQDLFKSQSVIRERKGKHLC